MQIRNINKEKCSVVDCHKSWYAKRFCQNHYYHFLRYGDPLKCQIKFYVRKGYKIDKDGYKLIRVNGKGVREHRYVMQKYLNRMLEPTEIVHHIDGNKLNNSIENLRVISSHSKHNSKYKYHNIRCLFCTRNAVSKNMCMRHYQQWRKGKIEMNLPTPDHGTNF